MAEIEFRLVPHRRIAITRLHIGMSDLAIGAPVRTLKWERQPVHQHGKGLVFGSSRVLWLQHLPQCRNPSRQTQFSNHSAAAAPVGNMSIIAVMVSPSRSDIPEDFRAISNSVSDDPTKGPAEPTAAGRQSPCCHDSVRWDVALRARSGSNGQQGLEAMRLARNCGGHQQHGTCGAVQRGSRGLARLRKVFCPPAFESSRKRA